METTLTKSFNDTPKDDQWYHLAEQPAETYIRWDFEEETWQKIEIGEDGEPSFVGYIYLH